MTSTRSPGPRPADRTLDPAVVALRMQRPADAERLATEALRSSPGNARAARILGQALMMQDRPGEAVAPLQRAARRAEDPATDILLARALAAIGRDDEALDRLRQATIRRPPFPQAFLELAGRLGRLGRPDEAIAVFESGLAVAPDAAVLRIGLGYLHLERRDRAKARTLFTQAQAAEPQRRDALVALATVNALDADHAAAADLYRRALQLQPDDAMTRINLGKCLLELGDRVGGEAALRDAVRGAPHLAGLAIAALAAASHGRFLLRPSAAARRLGA